MTMIRVLVCVLLFAGPRLARADSAVKEVHIGGQARPRLEFRDPVPQGDNDSFTSMRTRLQVRAHLERDMEVFAQVQDVRILGEETNTLGDFNADHFDLHQGYIDFGRLGGRQGFTLRLGRQEISLGGQRLIGAVNWTQQARAFDGARLILASGKTRLDVLGLRLGDSTAPRVERNAYLAGAYLHWARARQLEAFFFYNSLGSATDQVTLGVRQADTVSGWKYRFEFAFQTGDRGDQDVSAYMLGARLGRAFAPGASATLWYDFLSGDDDPDDGDIEVFDTLFPTNHKFYGFGDYFLNIPRDTANRGLQDLALKLSWEPRQDVKAGLDLHSFFLAEKAGIGSRHLGEELDLTLTYRYTKNATWVAGFSFVAQDDALEEIGRLDENAVWGYAMTNVAF